MRHTYGECLNRAVLEKKKKKWLQIGVSFFFFSSLLFFSLLNFSLFSFLISRLDYMDRKKNMALRIQKQA